MDATIIWAAVAAMGIPSAITGFCFWRIEKKITAEEEKEKEERAKRQAAAEEKERNREKYELYLMKSVNAAIALGEATARAVQRIPDAKCNGEMHAALDYAERVKHEQKDFLTEQAIVALQD